ncbi:T9SS type B sorting domain-containing protein [Chitinophaga ginsengisegetis]|uniref:T9SS type B sorting domain-containing protein n=1 Tax=Chitinophaga ginsengisegetis TaxID=393003 RepID=UPI000DBF3BCC|nr:gliding motility-associated C-terminal domain-containing protein [Chitinophaga ginsengisegetis]MDR6567665.1 gliding motility-associated-like protein [Chitinophaga ginsengisegetis]MDR6654130.1 gliding motility-associated-like protein [Chitinophaga ginsengisegetis]
MKRLLTFLYLILGFVLLNKQVAAQSAPANGTPFMNLPDTICKGSFASMNAFFWNNTSNYADSATWTITGGTYDVLFTTDNRPGHELVGQLRDNSTNINKNSLTIKFNDASQYQVTVVLFRGNNKYTVKKPIYVKDCTIQPCLGNTTSKSDFLEDFGKFKKNATDSRSNAAVTGYNYVPMPLNGANFIDDSYNIFWHTQIRSEWVKATDHTGSTVDSVGGMLIANSSINKKSFYTKNNVQVCPGSSYNFSAWFLNVNSYGVFNNNCAAGNWDGYHYAGVTFLIINKKGSTNAALWDTLARFKTYDVSMNLSYSTWQQYGGSFKTPGGVTAVTLEIVNDRLGDCGNDIAIDDIGFNYCSPDIYSFIDGQIDTELRADSLCEGAPITIKALYSPDGHLPNGTYDPNQDYFKNPIYQWFYSNTGDENNPADWFPVVNGNGISGAATNTLTFADGALKGDPNQIVHKYYRVNILESGNVSNCASPSKYTKITILPKPKVTISSGRICIGESVDLTADGGYSTYEWKVNPVYIGPKMTVFPDSTRDYWAIGIADYGWNSVKNEPRQCKDSGFARVIVDKKPVTAITGGPVNICLGAQVNLNLGITGAPADSLNWKWKYGIDSIKGKVPAITHVPADTGTKAYNVVVTNKTCVVVDTFRVNVRSVPVADVDTTYRQCNTSTFNIKRSTPPADQKGTWSFNGPSKGAVITSATTTATSVTGVPAGDTVRLFWVITNKALAACTDTNRITLINTKPLTPSVAGLDQVQCEIRDFQLNASKPGVGETGKWTLQPGTTSSDITINYDTAYNAIASVVSNARPKTFVLTWTISNGVCPGPNSTTVNLTIKDKPTLSVTAAAVCNNVASFTVAYSNVTPGTLTKYVLDVASTRKMPGFVTVAQAWPSNNTSGTFNVPLPANTPAGSYDFVITAQEDTLHGCSVTVPFSVSVEKPSIAPTAIDASTDSICVSGNVTLKVIGGSLGTDSLGNTHKWKWYTGACPGLPGSVAVTPASSINNGAEVVFNNVTATTTYYVRAESTGPCGNTACASVTVKVFAKPNAANASTDQTECERATDFQLAGNTPAPAGATGVWTSPNPRVTITNPTQWNATVKVPVGDTASLVWTISNGPCLTTNDTVFITNYKQPAVRDAGTNQIACDKTVFTLNATAPTELGAKGTWSFTPATASVIFADKNKANTTVTVPADSTVLLFWQISNSKCSAITYDTVRITSLKKPAVQNAGSNQIACDKTVFTLNASAPTELGAFGTWSFTPATASVVFADKNKANTTVTVPADSTVLLFWQISNSQCSANTYDTVRITSLKKPAVQNAGTNQIACDKTVFTLNATAPTELGAFGTWSFTPATASVVFADKNKANTTVTVPADSTVLLFWQISNSQCSAVTYDTVRITSLKKPAVQNAGTNQIACDKTVFTLNATAPTELGAFGTWSFTPATASVVFADKNKANTTVTVPADSTVLLFWQISNSQCSANTYDTVRITSLKKPAVQNAGTNQIACDKTVFTLNASAPTELGAFGTWSFTPATASVVFADKNKANTTVTVPADSTVLLFWQISNSQCSAVTYDTVRITSLKKPAVQNAGTNQIACDKTVFTLNATAPTELGAFGTWSFTPATASVVFADKNKANTTVTVPADSTVLLFWQISNSQCSATTYDTVRITSLKKPAVQNAGTNQIACDKTVFTLNATAPTELGAFGTWSFTPATASVVFADKNKANTTVTVPADSTVLLFWQISNSQCSAVTYDTVRITSLKKPAVQNAGTNQIACDKTVFTLNATAPTELGAFGTWSFTPATASVVFADKNKANTTVTVPADSTVLLFWQISNSQCSATTYDTVRITSLKKPAVQNAGTNQIACDKTVFTLNATAPTELGAFGTWSFTPATASVVFADKNKANTTVTVPADSTVLLFWQISNSQCSAVTYDTVRITSLKKPAVQNAGTNQIACDKTVFTLNASAPTELGAFGTWSFTPATASVVFADKNKANTTVTVPADSTVLLFWQISNSQCSATTYDTVRITSLKKPVMRDAGSNQIACDKTVFTLNATAPTELGAVGTWTFTPATASVVFADKNKANTTVTVPADSSVLLFWKIANTECAAANFDTVRITSLKKPIVRDAGSNQIACDKTVFTLNATAPTELGAVGTWTFTPATASVVFADKNSATTTVTVPADSSVLLFWKIANTECAAANFDTVRITSLKKPVMRDAGSNQIACDKNVFTLNATAPTELGAVGTWTFTPATASVVFADKNKANTTVTVPADSSVLLFWKIANIECAAANFDTVRITSLKKPIVRDAGSNQIACDKTVFTLNATAPTELGTKGTWSFTPATASVKFTNINDPKTSVTVPADSTVLLFWQISNSECAAATYDTVRITSLKKPIVRDAGSNQIACDKTVFTLNATAPTELGAKGTWSFTPATASVVFADKNKANTTVTVPADSTVLLFWQISNTECAAATYDTVRITSLKKPIVRDAGSNQIACDKTVFTLNATAPTELGTKGTWSFTPATASVKFTNINDPKTSVTVPADSTVLLFWQISNSECAAATYDTVRITSLKKPIVRDAGSNQIACDKTVFTLNATAPTELGAKGTWSFTPATASVVFADKNKANTTVTVPADSTVLLFWQISNTECAAATYDTVRITSLKKPIVRDAGSNQIACDKTVFTLNATAPTELGAKGTWSFTPATASVKFTNINDPKTSVTVPADSTVLLFWQISNSQCSAATYDTVRITSLKKPIVRDAGSNQIACDKTVFTLNATAPTELGAKGTWSFTPATASVKFVNINDPKTSVTVPADSTVLLFWQISNSQCSAATYDTVRITSLKKPIVRDAGSNQIACDKTVFTLNATAPTELGAKGTWSFTPATASVKFANINSATTTVTVPADSTVLLFWQISNSECAAATYDTVRITSLKKPIVRDAGSNQIACDKTVFTLNATAPTELGAKGTWSFTPATASVKFVNINDPKTSVTVPADSTVLLFWQISNSQCSAATYDTVRITSLKKPIVRDAGSNQIACDKTVFTLNATAPTELGAKGTWSFTPATASVKFANINDPKTSVTVPADSTVLLFWQISNSECAAATYDTVRITSLKKPIVRDAGSNQIACDKTVFTLNATAPTELGAKGTWSFTPATASVKFVNINDPKTSVTVPADSTVLLFWQISNSQCSAATYDTVRITSLKKPIVRDAGSNQIACDKTVFTLNATAPTELGAKGTWSFTPATASVKFANINSATTTVTVPADSTVLLFWQISNSECAAATYDTVRITSLKKPIVRDAGSNQIACDKTVFTLNATAPTELGAKGTWSFTPATASVKFTNINDPKTSVTVPADSTVLLFWQISNSQCSAATYDTVRITSLKKPIVRDAGSNQIACDKTVFTLNATAPTELGAKGTWSFTPATASVKFANINSATTTVTVPADSTVLLFWQISNSQCSAATYDTVRITSLKKPIVRDAGSNQIACDKTVFTLNATAPTELGAKGTWSFTPATASVKFANINSATTTVTVPADSTVLLFWQISNSQCSAATYDTVRITSLKKPIVRDAGSNQIACDKTVFTLNATAPTELGAKGTWSFTPATASVKFANINSATTTVTVPADSTVLLFWQISNSECAAATYDTVRITSLLKPIMRNAGADQMECDKTTFTLNATAPTELGAKGTWTFSPATASVKITNINDPKTTVTVPADSSILFTWKITNAKCAADNIDTIRITSLKKPVMRDAGTNKIACEQTSFTMNATAPTELGAIGTWTFSPATASVKITNINDPKTSVTVPADSSILFTWKITNPKCAADLADTVRITSYKTPAAAKAGPDQEQCDDVNFILNGSKPAGLHVTGTWTNPAGTAGVNISSPNQYNTTVTVAAGVSVKLVWKITNGTCAATYDTVMLTNYANANKANAGPDQALCNNTGDFIMAANVPGVPTAKGTWTDISPVPGKAKIKSPNSPTTAVTVPVGDTVILQWAIANGVCDTSFSRVTIINYKAAITANAGPDQEKCNTAADFIMKASQPGASSATGTWTDVSRVPGNAAIKSVNDPNTAVTVPVGDTVILKWTVTNGSCTSTSSTVTLINYKTAAAANAGTDIEMCNNTGDFTLAADPVSVPSAKGFWSVIKGNAAIRSINSPTSNVNINVGDTVTLRWTVTNGVCSATWDDVTLINYRLPVPANAGSDQEHCDNATFNMNASDPGVAGAKGTWIVTSNNATLINISDINRKDATITVPAGETAQLTWVVSNGVCDASSSSVTLINRKPILGNTIQDDQTVCVTETPMAIRSIALTGGNGTYTYQWQQSTAGANGPFTNITGATSATYQPGLLAANTWYRRVVASGACINNISNVVKITAITISPIVTFTPPAITTECERGKDYTTLFGDPAFSHAPYNNEPLTITHNDVTVVTSPCLSTITRTWTATDRCGLSVSASQTITVKDTKAPVFTTQAPADTTVDCDKVPAKTDLKANDDCAGEIIIPVVEVRQDLPGNCSNNYLLIRTWTAKDECNTGVTLKQVITVKDMTAPVFNMAAPADTTVDCDKIPAGFNLTASDNCTPGVITVVPKDSAARNTNNCNNNYVIYRKWTAFDECGNARAVQQIIRVQDTTRPVFSMPAPKDTVVDCDKVPAWPAITATDNCSGSIQVFTSTKTVKLPGNCARNFQETRTWTATDECGNKSVMQQIITVQDTTKPVFTVMPPADTTVSCDNIPAPATDVQVSDNCSSIGNGLTVSRRITTERTPGECAGNYRIIRTWIAKDACGNTATITQVVTVKDTTRPVIMPAPADVEIYCQDKIPTAPVLTATDNCDNSFPKRAIYTEDPYVEDICNGYTIVRRWTIMDACGNKANDVIQRVIIKPCDKPQLEATLPSNCSDNGRIALRKVGNVYLPSYTLVAVTPANAVTGLPRTQSNNVFNLNGATSASFIITDGRTGCSSDTVTYNLNYIQKPMVNLGNDTTICGGNNLVLDAGPANFAYQIKWSTGATTQRININQAGTYWVNVSNGECATTDTIHVGLVPTPLVDIPDTTICRGQTVKLDAYVNGGSYLWSNGSTEPSILVGTQEQFWVKVMKSGCITIDTVKVSVNPPPDISLSRDTSICPDQSIMLTVNSNGGRIKWQTGETSNSIVVNKPGGYWVAVSRDNCVVRDTVNVRMKPALTMELGPDRNICPGGTITLDGTNPDAVSYLWNDGDPNPVKQISQAGSYKLAVMDKYCQRVFMDSLKVNITGLPVINLGRDTTLCKGETLILRAEGGGITGVRWDNGSGGPSLTVTNGGTYTVTVFNDCGSATDDITVGFIECEPKPTLPNAFSPNGDGRNDVFRPVVRGQMFDYELRIFNRWGELIFMSSDNHKGWDGKYKGVPVDVGTYVWWLSYKKVAGGSSNVLKGEVTVIR